MRSRLPKLGSQMVSASATTLKRVPSLASKAHRLTCSSGRKEKLLTLCLSSRDFRTAHLDGPRFSRTYRTPEMPKLFVEYVGMGDSDKPKDYAYSTAERTDLVEAIW